MAQILKGRPVARDLKERLRKRTEALHAMGVVPTLALLRVGLDPASEVYVTMKEKGAREVGIIALHEHLPAEISAAALLERIRIHGEDPTVHGILVQLPLPGHIPEDEIIAAVPPKKDVDGFHPINQGLLAAGTARFVPGTPLGILRILEYYEIAIEGEHVVIIGRSRIVGRPLANLLSTKGPLGNATVTLCHTFTRDLANFTRSADIIIAAAGQKRFLTAEMVSPAAVVIDVGIHREEHPDQPGKMRVCGDTDYAVLKEKVRAITPVPGGVGPMTVAAVLENTVIAAERASRP